MTSFARLCIVCSRECLAAIVAVPDDHLVSASGEKASHSRVDFAGQQLPQLAVLGVCLLLAADSSHAFAIRNHEDGLGGLTRARQHRRKNEENEPVRIDSHTMPRLIFNHSPKTPLGWGRPKHG
jgi:hypothetical protein